MVHVRLRICLPFPAFFVFIKTCLLLPWTLLPLIKISWRWENRLYATRDIIWFKDALFLYIVGASKQEALHLRLQNKSLGGKWTCQSCCCILHLYKETRKKQIRWKAIKLSIHPVLANSPPCHVNYPNVKIKRAFLAVKKQQHYSYLVLSYCDSNNLVLLLFSPLSKQHPSAGK